MGVIFFSPDRINSKRWVYSGEQTFLQVCMCSAAEPRVALKRSVSTTSVFSVHNMNQSAYGRYESNSTRNQKSQQITHVRTYWSNGGLWRPCMARASYPTSNAAVLTLHLLVCT